MLYILEEHDRGFCTSKLTFDAFVSNLQAVCEIRSASSLM